MSLLQKDRCGLFVRKNQIYRDRLGSCTERGWEEADYRFKFESKMFKGHCFHRIDPVRDVMHGTIIE